MTGLFAGIALGVFLGVISGILPGIHVNTLAAGLLALQVPLLSLFGPEMIAASMVAAMITHTFIDIIPSTFLGIPDADTAISVIPSHALCLEGKGEEAVRIAALGNVWGFIIAIPISILLIIVAPYIQEPLDWLIGIILATVAAYLILSGESPFLALVAFLVSGILGIFTFTFSYAGNGLFGSIGILMPLLSGLFGISLLLSSGGGKVPDQKFEGMNITSRTIVRGGLSGTFAGIMVGWLPGLSNATANGLIAALTNYRGDPRGYIFATSTANTVNALAGLAALYAISRTRNGVMVALSSLETVPLGSLLLAAGIAAIIAYLLTIYLAGASWRLGGINKQKLNICVIAFITLLSFLFCGPFGLVVLLLATMLGTGIRIMNIPQMYAIGAIMVPVILFAFGISIPSG